jgi:hypothetical protein
MSGEYILISTFKKKAAFLVIFKSISAGNRPFWRHCHIFQAAWKAYVTSLTPSNTNPLAGTPPAKNRRTKQFLSHPHCL